jgi:hypothetical protein
VKLLNKLSRFCKNRFDIEIYVNCVCLGVYVAAVRQDPENHTEHLVFEAFPDLIML